MKFFTTLEDFITFLEPYGFKSDVKKQLQSILKNTIPKQNQIERRIATDFFELMLEHLDQYFNGEDKLGFFTTNNIVLYSKKIHVDFSLAHKLCTDKQGFDEKLYDMIYNAVVYTIDTNSNQRAGRLKEALEKADPKNGVDLSGVFRDIKAIATRYKYDFNPKADLKTNLKTIMKKASDDDQTLDLIQHYATNLDSMAGKINPADLLTNLDIDTSDIKNVVNLKDKFLPKVMDQVNKIDPNIKKELGI